MDQETKSQKVELSLKGEEFNLEDKLGQLWELGFNPYNLKLLTKSYRSSKCAMDGVAIDCGNFILRIGPQTQKTWTVKALKVKALEYLGLNPYAARAFAREFLESRMYKQGLNILIDDINVMIGPQNKNTFLVR